MGDPGMGGWGSHTVCGLEVDNGDPSTGDGENGGSQGPWLGEMGYTGMGGSGSVTVADRIEIEWGRRVVHRNLVGENRGTPCMYNKLRLQKQ